MARPPVDVTPNSIPWPPLIYGMAALASIVLQWLIPLAGMGIGWLRWVGAVLMLAGLVLDGSAMLSMHRRNANILPHRAATALVVSWPFSVSRNPIYLGNTLLLIGAALAFENPWFALTAAVAVYAVTVLAITREEAHLAAKFGESWRRYAEYVPRWFRLLP